MADRPNDGTEDFDTRCHFTDSCDCDECDEDAIRNYCDMCDKRLSDPLASLCYACEEQDYASEFFLPEPRAVPASGTDGRGDDR